MTSKQWFLVHTRPQAEERAAAHLMRQGFDVYFPRYMKLLRHARRSQRAARPLFPRYLFVNVDPQTQALRPIHSTVGVHALVSFGSDATTVPEAIVSGLKAREDAEGYVTLAPRKLVSGDGVRLLTGPFADSLGLYESARDNERVSILLELLGRKVRILVEENEIEANH